jgi:hypothetical protein
MRDLIYPCPQCSDHEVTPRRRVTVFVRPVTGVVHNYGHIEFPSDLDPATRLVLEEISKLGVKILNSKGSEIVITPDNFKLFWQKVNEFTSSSMSGVHYGHYKAAIQDKLISEVFALQLTVVARSGIDCSKGWQWP